MFHYFGDVRMSVREFDVIVVGEGISGLTAAATLVGRGLRVATFEQTLFGGLVLNINELRPGPRGEPASGADLGAILMEKNFEAGVTSVQEPVTGVEQDGGGFAVVTPGGRYRARQVLLACGARLKKLDVPGEEQFAGRGVSHCAGCDGPMNVGTPVVVVGGGDSALQEALVLTQFASKVILVHRGEKFRAREEFAKEVLAHPKIQVIWNANVAAIGGDKAVKHVRVLHAGGRTEDLACTGVFAYIGLQPSTDYLPPTIEKAADGAVLTNAQFETSVPGVWAIGAVRHGYAGQLPNAVAEADAVAAALSGRLAAQPA